MDYKIRITKVYKVKNASSREEAIRVAEEMFLQECKQAEKIEDIFEIRTTPRVRRM